MNFLYRLCGWGDTAEVEEPEESEAIKVLKAHRQSIDSTLNQIRLIRDEASDILESGAEDGRKETEDAGRQTG